MTTINVNYKDRKKKKELPPEFLMSAAEKLIECRIKNIAEKNLNKVAKN